ncbi:hypothetical protein Tco_1367258 [Tanacetum coccineum]
MNQNFYNSNSFGFDQLQPPQYPVIHNPPQETSVEILQAKEDLMKLIQTFLKKFNHIYFGETAKVLLLAWEKFFEIQHAKPEDIQELLHKLLKDLQIISEELSEFINCPSCNHPTFYDDDDEEYTIQYREYLENSSKAIAPDLPTKRTCVSSSLSMGDKHLDTISETELDIENLVPIPSESEVTSDNESECDVPVNDESSPIFTTFSNPLFDSNDDFTFSDDESLSDEDVPMENFKIYSNPLFDNEEIISTKIDPHYFNVESNLIESLLNRDTLIDSSPKFNYLLDEFSGELAHINLIPPGIEEADFDLEEEIRLVKNLSYDNSSPRPPEELNAEIADTILESLSPSPIPVEDTIDIDILQIEDEILHEKLLNVNLLIDKIEALNLTPSILFVLEYPSSSPIPVVDSDFLIEEVDTFLVSENSIPPGIESDFDSERDIIFLDDLLNDDPIPELFFRFSPTLRILLYFSSPGVKTPFLTPTSPLRTSGISSGWSFHDCPDFEDSRARCFVHRSLALQILSMLILGIRYPKSHRLTFIY